MSDLTPTIPKRLMVSPQQAAEMLGVDRDTILRWLKAGKLAGAKLSPRIVRVSQASIDALLERGKL